MATWKCDLIFDGRRSGWTESFYREEDSATEATQATIDLAKIRSGMLGQGYDLKWARVSDVAVRGDAKPTNLDGITAGAASEAAPYVGSGWLLRIFSTNQIWRFLVLRGFYTAGYSTDDGVVTLTASGLKAIQVYGDHLVSNGWQIRGHDKQQEDANKQQIKSLSVNATGTRWVMEADNHGLQTFDKVFITGPARKFYECIGGTANVFVLDANTFELGKQPPPGDIKAYQGGLFFAKRDLGFRDITAVSPIRFTKRDTGRPLFLSRGRRLQPSCPV